MTSKRNLHVSSRDRKTGEREIKLPSGTRKHIRKLKREGNFKEATLVRNTAIEHKTSVLKK